MQIYLLLDPEIKVFSLKRKYIRQTNDVFDKGKGLPGRTTFARTRFLHPFSLPQRVFYWQPILTFLTKQKAVSVALLFRCWGFHRVRMLGLSSSTKQQNFHRAPSLCRTRSQKCLQPVISCEVRDKQPVGDLFQGKITPGPFSVCRKLVLRTARSQVLWLLLVECWHVVRCYCL